MDPVTAHIINKVVVDAAFQKKKNAKDMRNNTMSLNVVSNRLKEAIREVRRKVKAAEEIMPAQGGALLVPQIVTEWLIEAQWLQTKVDATLRKAHRLYPPGDATASAPADACSSKLWANLKDAVTIIRIKWTEANRVLKYDEVVTKFLDKSEASTKATMNQLLLAPQGKFSLEKEIKELERARDDIAMILDGVKYRVDWPQLSDERHAWHQDIGDMRAEVEEMKKEYSNKMQSSSEITSDWLVAFNEKTSALVSITADALKRSGVELKAKAEELVACLDNVVTKMEELSNAKTVLLARKTTIQGNVAVARSDLLVLRGDVLRWLERVGQAEGEFLQADAVLQQLASISSGSAALTRWQELGKKVVMIKCQVENLVAESMAFDQGVVDLQAPPPMRPEPLENVIGQGRYLEMVRSAGIIATNSFNVGNNKFKLSIF